MALLAELLDEPGPVLPAPALGVLGLCAVLGAAGLFQSVLRDSVSAWRYPVTAMQVIAQAEQRQASGAAICAVPARFTLLLPATAFEPSFEPRLKDCVRSESTLQVDLTPLTALREHNAEGLCEHPPERAIAFAWLARLFHSGSGYGVAVCPAVGPGRGAG